VKVVLRRLRLIDVFNSWNQSLVPNLPTEVEYQNLSITILAWELRLDAIVVFPYGRYFAQCVIGRHHGVPASTRNDPDSYSRALQLGWDG
jgi:hypothetical protein